jgi:hypothetical protein
MCPVMVAMLTTLNRITATAAITINGYNMPSLPCIPRFLRASTPVPFTVPFERITAIVMPTTITFAIQIVDVGE